MKYRIVIVGGGAGGLELATRLGTAFGGNTKVNVTLVDSNLTHIWKPLFHEVAAGSLNTGTDEVNYLAQARWSGFAFQHGQLTKLCRTEKLITLKDPFSNATRTLAYDTLVISVGSLSNDFGTLGVQEHCLFLDSRTQAERLQKKLLQRHLRSHAETVATPLRIAIVGAGATGVELSAELHHAMVLINSYGMCNSDRQSLHVSLIEAAPRVLPALNERISDRVTRSLKEMGVSVRTSVAVKEVTENGLTFVDGSSLDADFKIWAAGIRAPAFLKELDGLEVNRINQLVVRPTLQSSFDDNIFALGDCAACPMPGEDKKFVPPRAQAANQQAKFLASSLQKVVAGRALPEFVYRDKGTLISLASFNAVGVIGREKLTQGRVARLLYRSLYRAHQGVLFGVNRTLLKISSEMLQRKTKPRLRLH
ncbi:NAD(P)/FAD-dependent oxidoreductase [Pseudomonas sp. Pseusp16]|uniref:NAD(P)/FAD-dependent oxidoreductase n=1 Tax=Pseudomonas sp. Pseusp16 TaxID=3243021 RepID=UPI0039B392AA